MIELENVFKPKKRVFVSLTLASAVIGAMVIYMAWRVALPGLEQINAKLPVVFGGIGLGGLLLMAGGLLLTGIFVGSIGIFCSVVFKRTTLATVLSYVIVVFLVVGICACTGLAYYAGLLQQEMTAAYQQIDVGGVIYLLLFNPFTSFAGIISRQLGNGREMEQLCYLLGNYGQNPLIHYLPEASAVLQLLISAVLLVTAGRKLNPLNK